MKTNKPYIKKFVKEKIKVFKRINKKERSVKKLEHE